MYVEATTPAALDVFGTKTMTDCSLHRLSKTVVVMVDASNVNVPLTFNRPANMLLTKFTKRRKKLISVDTSSGNGLNKLNDTGRFPSKFYTLCIRPITREIDFGAEITGINKNVAFAGLVVCGNCAGFGYRVGL